MGYTKEDDKRLKIGTYCVNLVNVKRKAALNLWK